MIQLLVVSCLSLAAKMEETDVPLLLDLQRSWESRPEGVYFRGNQFVIKFGGLIISESNGACDISQVCPDMPGIWKEQVEAWKTIVNDVHEKGGIFFCQIWHKGFKPDYNQEKFIFAGGIETHYQVSSEVSLTPHHLTTEDMSGIIHDFRVAALNAMEAGFNWVEIHSVNGYLMENEVYGGSLENHCRLALEVVEAVANEIGAEKVGVKLSPFYDSNGTGVSLWKC